MHGQQDNILLPVAKRRDVDEELIQSMVEVGPERAGAHGFTKIDVGRRHNTDVQRNAPGTTHRLDLSLLNDPKQLRLNTRGEITDFIQENGPSVGCFELAYSAFSGAREGPLLVAEEFALHQCLRQRRTIHSNKGLRTPVAVLVDDSRGDTLSGAALTAEQDGYIGGGDQLDQLIEAPHAFALPDELPGKVLPVGRAGRWFPCPAHSVLDKGHVDQAGEGIVVYRFRNIVIGTEFHCCHRIMDALVAGQDDHRNAGLSPLEPSEQLDSVHVRQSHVQDHQRPRLLLQRSPGIHSRMDRRDVASGPSQQSRKNPA